MKNILFVILATILASLTSGCVMDRAQKHFYACYSVISLAHTDFKSIDDIREINRDDIGGGLRGLLKTALANEGMSYPKGPSIVMRDCLLVTWVDKEDKLHLSIVQKGKEIGTGFFIPPPPAPEQKG